MQIKNKIALAASGIALVSLFGVSQVLAQNKTGNYPPFIQQLAQKLGIDQSKVQTAFDEIRQENKSQMQAKLEDRLNQAVKDGKITEAQKTAILNKLQEQNNNMPNKTSLSLRDRSELKNQTPEQRKQAMEQKRAELENWAKQNGLTLQTLQEILGHGGKGFWMGYGLKGMMWR